MFYVFLQCLHLLQQLLQQFRLCFILLVPGILKITSSLKVQASLTFQLTFCLPMITTRKMTAMYMVQTAPKHWIGGIYWKSSSDGIPLLLLLQRSETAINDRIQKSSWNYSRTGSYGCFQVRTMFCLCSSEFADVICMLLPMSLLILYSYLTQGDWCSKLKPHQEPHQRLRIFEVLTPANWHIFQVLTSANWHIFQGLLIFQVHKVHKGKDSNIH